MKPENLNERMYEETRELLSDEELRSELSEEELTHVSGGLLAGKIAIIAILIGL